MRKNFNKPRVILNRPLIEQTPWRSWNRAGGKLLINIFRGGILSPLTDDPTGHENFPSKSLSNPLEIQIKVLLLSRWYNTGSRVANPAVFDSRRSTRLARKGKAGWFGSEKQECRVAGRSGVKVNRFRWSQAEFLLD